MVNGMTRSNGLSPATSRPFIPIGLSVAWETEGKGQRSTVTLDITVINSAGQMGKSFHTPREKTDETIMSKMIDNGDRGQDDNTEKL